MGWLGQERGARRESPVQVMGCLQLTCTGHIEGMETSEKEPSLPVLSLSLLALTLISEGLQTGSTSMYRV